MRDESRGAHFKPDFSMPGLKAVDPGERRREAEAWCDEFEAHTQKWLKSTISQHDGEHPRITYEDVDTSLIPPRPRMYGLVGAELIEEAWKQRQSAKSTTAGNVKPSVASASTVGV